MCQLLNNNEKKIVDYLLNICTCDNCQSNYNKYFIEKNALNTISKKIFNKNQIENPIISIYNNNFSLIKDRKNSLYSLYTKILFQNYYLNK